MPTFEYDSATINAMSVITEIDDKTGRKKATGMNVADRVVNVTPRFWGSFFARYGISNSIFKYYDHAEVFERIAEKDNSELRTCIETDDNGNEHLLAISSLTSPILTYEDLSEIIQQYSGESAQYSMGMMESLHRPSVGGTSSTTVLGDAFEHRYLMTAPIDGYGLPNLYLALLRQVCSNGMVAMTKMFKSSLAMGKKDESVNYIIKRALEGFNNEEGYVALKDRVTSAGQSWASVRESEDLYAKLLKLYVGPISEAEVLSSTPHPNGVMPKLLTGTTARNKAAIETASPILNAFQEMTGDTTRLYGVTNTASISEKKQRVLPVKCKVYDLINFATEVATHHAGPRGARLINGWVGELIGREYDLENTCTRFSDFAAFHMDSKLANAV